MSKYLVAYATLLALRKNVDGNSYHTKESYVNEFHQALSNIEQEVGVQIFRADDFRVGNQLLAPQMVSNNYLTHEVKYSKERYCETNIFLTKIDATLNYLQLIAPKEDKQKMGF